MDVSAVRKAGSVNNRDSDPETETLRRGAGFEQDIEGDHSFYPDNCHTDVLATTRNQESAADSAY
ncbi:hypothetical protein AMECASPLE_022169, partial [Ameca splendens]